MKLPIGISDFKRLREENYYLIDKSLFIKDVIDDSAEVILITRPRRFGKTLNMSMLSYYFDRNDTSAHSYFETLAIWQQAQMYQQERGKYPVVFLTLKGLKCANYDEAMEELQLLIQNLFKRYEYLLESAHVDIEQKNTIARIINKTASMVDLRNSLKLLTQYLAQHHNTKPIVLIDEYDAPIHAAFLNDYYRPMINFMQHFLGEALKDNSFLHKGILTGILRVAKESIFSGINNLQVYGIDSSYYSYYFGFLQHEVDHLLQSTNYQNHREQVRFWYNGYRFGEQDIYNPWSILQYVKNNGEFNTYWVNTSDNALVNQLLVEASPYFQGQFEKLLQGEWVEEPIEENLILTDLHLRQELVWTLLVYSGYLKITSYKLVHGRKLSHISIPNEELKSLLYQLVVRWFPSNLTPSYNPTINALLQGDIPKFQQGLSRYLTQTFSYYDTTSRTPEQIYHAFVLGLVAGLSEFYRVRSNREAGSGRYDVVIIPKDKTKMGIIFEFKALEANARTEDLKKAAELALTQIHDKAYHTEFQQADISNVLQLGIAFAGKQVEMVSDQMTV